MNQDDFLQAQVWVGILQVVAVILSAILAVWIDRHLQRKREERNAKLQILKILMATRGTSLSADHINALNLLDFEFYDAQDVRQAWKEYLTHLGDSTHIGTPEWGNRRHDLLINLIGKVATNLGYHYDHVDLKSNSYLPTGWSNSEREILRLFE
jgi:hypothetical protein